VTDKTLDIATFSDPGNTIEPSLDIEFFQSATAFAAWCNAAGGIDGRKLVVHNRDAALFNAGQVTTDACSSDFMSVGGGMALDTPSVSIRVACGLGQIPAFVVSNQSVAAPLQVDPLGLNNSQVEAGWYAALAKLYPQAVKSFGITTPNTAEILQTTVKYRDAAVARGYTISAYQMTPQSVNDWAPYISDLQQKGVKATQLVGSMPAPYVQAMNTAGYSPTFMLLGPQYYEASTTQGAAQAKFPPTWVPITAWPFEMVNQNASLHQMVQVMKKYSPGSTIDTDDQDAFNAWLLFAKAANSCDSTMTVNCVLSHAASQKNWSAGGMFAPIAQLALSNQNPHPTTCFALMKAEPNKFVYNKAATEANSSIYNCRASNVVSVSSGSSS
jgi:ABC-type branched-subunit amino acid transport system substrate-binding protein